MGFIGNKPTDVPLTSEQIADGTITSADLAAGVANDVAKNASQDSNIALLGFLRSTDHATSVLNMQNGYIDQFEDQTGVDDTNSVGGTYDASGDFYGPTAGAILSDVNFSYTGANQTWVVPAGITSIIFKAWGAGGGGGGGSAIGGGGGFVQETISVTAGETLNIKVGGAGVYEGVGASKKGGGGGWTSIDRSATYLAGAGGGGGAGTSGEDAGAGGGTTGGTGAGSQPGSGGTQIAGGAAGTGGTAGTSLTGGTVPAGSSNDAAGGYNGGGGGDGDNATYTSGGGGGGYFGGGSGGNTTTGGAGGGGSSYAPTGTNTQASGGVVANAGDADYPGSVGDGGTQATGENGYAVVIPRYSATNLTLISEPQVALTAPDSAHVSLFNEEVDTLTINTDILAWVSRSKQTFTATNATNVLNATTHGLVDTDRVMVISSGADLPNGLTSDIVYYVVTAATSTLQVSLTSGGAAVTFSDDGTGTHSILAVTQTTLTDQGDFDTGKATLSGTVDISGQPSDTDMTLIVQTKNSKETKLHGQALQYA